MPEEQKLHWRRFVLYLLVLFMLYPLSMGPAGWVANTFYAHGMVGVAYGISNICMPLSWLADQVPMLDQIRWQYLSLWVEIHQP